LIYWYKGTNTDIEKPLLDLNALKTLRTRQGMADMARTLKKVSSLLLSSVSGLKPLVYEAFSS
jgi:hypothetical protein